MTKRPASDAGPGEPPPLLGSWVALYACVIGLLAASIVFLYWLARRWS